MTRRVVLSLAVVAVLAAACSEAEPEEVGAGEEPSTTDAAPSSSSDESGDETGGETTDPAPETTDEAGGGDSVVEQFAGEPWFLGTVPDTPVPADDSLEPIRIGMINQEDTPIGSFPEMRFAADAAVNWINAELGGVGGRPIELIPCITPFSLEASTACAQDLVGDDVVAIVGGIDVQSAGSIPIIEQNGIPVIGGIPAGTAEQRSPNHFAFSGGTAGAMAAMISHAHENGATKVAIAYGEFDAFTITARDYAARVGESLGLEVELVPFSITTTDFLPTMTAIKNSGANAVIVAAADTACVPVMQLFLDLEIDGQLYLVGACAAEAIIDDADGTQQGVVFSGEGPPDTDDVEGSIYDLVTDTEAYTNGNAKAAGTVGFRGMMNLYGLLVELGPDDVSRESIIGLVRAAVERESFWGHPYTCDGNQVPGLPALCAPQQTLFEIPEQASDVVFITDWIDTVELFANAFAE